jgi:hypothetical protein
VTWSWASAWEAGPLRLASGQPVVTYSATPGMPEVFGTWCAAAFTVAGPLPTPGGMTSALAPLFRLAACQATPPMITARRRRWRRW